ncbi:MAG: glutamate 5-kinase [SAR202 cluster bacterium]|nr:glutamate 5-kinase [SAR202 cluster bacterium]
MKPQKPPTIGDSQATSTSSVHQPKRVVVKAGSALLTHGGDRLNRQVMASLTGQLAQLRKRGLEVALVTSGAVAAGRLALGIARENRDLPMRQVMAAVGQGQLMHAYEQLFSEHGVHVAQALLTRHDLRERLGYLNVRNTLLKLMELGVIPIVNENDVVAVDELGGQVFGDNDTLSALVANLVDADLLVLLGQVEGLYTADPNVDATARLVPRVEQVGAEVEAMGGASRDGLGRGGMATKLEAAKVATSSGTGVVIANGLTPDVLVRLADGEPLGTYFVPVGNKLESRKRWLLSGTSAKGAAVVDDGAASALTRRGGSLLPAGIVAVQGVFERGDVVSIVDKAERRVAAGIVNYGSKDLDIIKGARSERIGELLGYDYGDEVVHRNNMAVL